MGVLLMWLINSFIYYLYVLKLKNRDMMKHIIYKIGLIPQTSEIVEVYDSSGIYAPQRTASV